jgi:hypothetical protein
MAIKPDELVLKRPITVKRDVTLPAGEPVPSEYSKDAKRWKDNGWLIPYRDYLQQNPVAIANLDLDGITKENEALKAQLADKDAEIEKLKAKLAKAKEK